MMGNVALVGSRVWRQTVLAGVSGLMLGSIIGCLLIVWSHQGAPVIVHEEHEIDGTALRNGHIDLYVELDRVRDCPSDTSRWLWTWTEKDGQRIKQFYPMVHSTTAPSDLGDAQHFIIRIPVPSGVWAGNWFYFSKTFEHCSLLSGLFRNPTRESGNIPVRILDEAP